jgi:hypothetical protein
MEMYDVFMLIHNYRSSHTYTYEIKYEYSHKRNITSALYITAENAFQFYMVHKISDHTY